MKRSVGDKLFDISIYSFLSIVLLVTIYPLFFVVLASFSDPLAVLGGKVLWRPISPNLKAYQMVFRYQLVLTGYRNTLMYTSAGTLLNVVMTIVAAYPISRPYLKGRQVIIGMMLFTMFFTGGLIPTYIMIHQMGMLNSFWVMIIPNAVAVWNIMIMRTFFITSIPRELEEAALVDGSSHIKTLLRIILPLSKPIIAVMVVFYAVGHWNSYFNGLIFLSSESKFPLQLVLRAILIQNQRPAEIFAMSDTYSRQMMAETMKYALIIISSLPVLMLYPFAQRFFVQGIMIGSVKG